MRYPCPDSEYAATQPAHLKRQVESKHDGVGYPCPQCKYAATKACDLKTYVKSKHEELDILVCNVSMLQLRQVT